MDMHFDIVRLVDAVILFTVLECALLLLVRQLTGRGVAARDFVVNLVSGLCLMLALRCLAAGAGPLAVALCLLAAGTAHAVDLSMRWRRAGNAASSPTEVTA